MKAPFRADHVGSLIRPARLRDAQRAKQAGDNVQGLKDIEDAAIREAVALQERASIEAVTDARSRAASTVLLTDDYSGND